MDDSEPDEGISGSAAEVDQEDREIDQRSVDNSANDDPDNLRIEAAKLFTQATEQTRMALCVSDPRQEDCPIVYVNEAFVRLTGYDREEIVGRNCRFLQGADTDPDAVARIRDALAAEEVRVIDILNYKKDGTPFWNALHVGPMFDDDGDLQYYYGSQWDVTDILENREQMRLADSVAMELKHRTGNLFAIINAIVNLSEAGSTDIRDYRDKLVSRIGALHRAHKVSLDGEGAEASVSDLRTMIEAIMRPYGSDDPDRVKLAGNAVSVPRAAVTPIGLALHELATNALKYGALRTDGGQVCIDWEVAEDDLTIEWVELNEARVDPGAALQGTGTGRRIMLGVLSQIDGTLENSMADDGLRATITIPDLADNALPPHPAED